MDETTAKVFEQLENLRRQFDELTIAFGEMHDDLQQQIADQAARINDLGLRLKQLERPRMTNDEALQTFDILKRNDPSLTLPSFAAQHGLSYNALRQARSRRRKKT